MAKLTAKLRNGQPGASREALRASIIIGRLCGPQESYTNEAMQWGLRHEGSARRSYQFAAGFPVVEEVGCIPHPMIPNTLASPDGLVGTDGLVEIKCPMTHNHIEYLLTGAIPDRYKLQMQWQMACCERDWCDFVSFDPRLPPRMQLYKKRYHRQDAIIIHLEKEVVSFLLEVECAMKDLDTLYPREVSA
jgi:putative phage-type endonuclease